MNKNRRKSNYTPIINLFDDQNYHSQFKENFNPDKQNQAKLILLGIGNEEANFHNQFSMDDFGNRKDSLLKRTKVLEDKKHKKSMSKNLYQPNENVLSQIDNNANFHLNNFFEDNRTKTSYKKQRFSMKNIRSKQNLSQIKFDPIQETKREQKTIFKLKNILKKLQSPQKLRNSSDYSQFDVIESIMKKKKMNRISGCSSQLQKSSKQKNRNQLQKEFFTSSRLLNRGKQQHKKGFEIRTESRNSHEKRKDSGSKMVLCKPNETQTKFFHKSNKLTNQSIIFKRNSLNTNDLVKKNCYTQPFKKSNRHISSYQVCNFENDKNMFQDIFIQQQKIKEERKNRNLRNILFD